MALTLICKSGVGIVTGANFLLTRTGDETTTSTLPVGKVQRVLVDCGLIQGEVFSSQENRKAFTYNPAEIDVLMVTHAHLDHVGRIPKLIKDGFRGVIYSTPETKAIAALILDDAVGLLDREAREQGLLPLYSREDVAVSFVNWKTIPYHVSQEILPGISVFLKDAGHVLGSSMIEFSSDGKKVVLTGDLGNTPTPLLRDTEIIDSADYLLMESVYGDRNHEPKDERDKRFARVIRETVERGGTVVIPTFSMERTQVLLFELNNLVEKGLIPSVPVFVDSPLATRITEVYRRSVTLFNPETQAQIARGDDVFNFSRLKFVGTADDSKSVDRQLGAKIILAGSGMSTGGRVTQHEAAFLPDPQSTILLVGYQTPGTLGRKLQEGVKKIQIGGQTVKVHAKIETIFGYSAHKDSDHLVEFVSHTAHSVKKVFVAMGEPKSALFLVQRLRDELGVDALYPEREKEYPLI